MKLVVIPGGEFLMGSPDSDKNARSDEKPHHSVRITKSFYLGMHEVTQAQYTGIMGQNPSRNKSLQDWPVDNVAWNDAVEFCRRLSGKEGVTYRLPTEAEWEYACRAGSTTAWSCGDSESPLGDYACYAANSSQTTHPIGKRKPNAWGLYDMHGNVWEWCQDWYDGSYYGQFQAGVAVDPQGPPTAAYRVLRGGGWNSNGLSCRSANRYGNAPAFRDQDDGFRVVLVRPDAS
jgi:formylglycine-generating enzyme required for sulfatase activity